VIKRVREMEWEKGKYGDHTFMERGEGRAFTSEGLLPCLSYLDVSVLRIPAEDEADSEWAELSATASNAAAL
jgi:hypothetical protein